MKTGDLQGREEKDVFGNSLRPFKPTQSKAVQPSDAEQLKNPRSRSARLRTAVRQ
jgi:16S rRNA (cytosine1402-N4)-methyltransferase